MRAAKKAVHVILVLVGLLILTSPTQVLAQQAARDMKTFYFASLDEPSTIDPAYAEGDIITDQVYESLLTYKGSTFDVMPRLAESWEVSPDQRVYTFHLRHSVTFSDGTTFNAEAVKFSFIRMLKMGQGLAWAFGLVLGDANEASQSIEVVDAYTVRMTLKYSYPPFLGLVAGPHSAPIISPSVMTHEVNGDLGEQWAVENAIGTGPYMLQKWTRNVELVLVKNPNYWAGWAGDHVEKIVLKIVPEPSTQRLMLEQGDIDSASHITLDDVYALRSNPDIKILDTNGKSCFNFFILMNTRKGLLKDIRLREALSYAYDYEGTVKDVFKGAATQARGPLPISMTKYHNDNVFVYHRDLAKAKQLLAEAGYPNGGFTLSIGYFAGQDWGTRIVNVLTSNLGELGIKLEPVPLTWEAMMSKMMNQETAPDLQVGDMWPDYPDPDSQLTGAFEYWTWGSREERDYFYFNQILYNLLRSAAVEANETKRIQYYKDAQAMFVADVPAIWVLDLALPVPLRKEVQGYVYNAIYEMGFRAYIPDNVALWKQPVSTPASTSIITSASTTAAQPPQSSSLPLEYIVVIVVAIVFIAGSIIAYKKTRPNTKPNAG